jgi:DNA modification methylase
MKLKHAYDFVPIDGVRPDPRNARHHPRPQIRQIANSIKAFGFIAPIIVDRNGRIIVGHGRWLAARLLGLTEIPVIRVEHLSEAQARAYAIADNRLTETSRWDEKLLGAIFADLLAVDLDFSIEDTGFSVVEIDSLIDKSTGAIGSKAPEEDPTDLKSEHPVSRLNDLWTLGRHRLLCGDSLKLASFERLMERHQAAVVFVDPPYNVRTDGHATGNGRIKHRQFAMASGEVDAPAFRRFLATACRLLADYSRNGAIHFICMDWAHIGVLLTVGEDTYSRLLNICVWVKNNGGMGSFYRSQHELVCVFRNGREQHRNNVQLGKFGRNRTNIWHYPNAATFSRGEEGNLLAAHPTVKPEALVADALLDCSVRGDIVLDSFLGSGTTLLAAERTGRVCFGLEIDPLYVDLAIRRWQRQTGEKAVNAETGRPFDEIAGEVSHG